MQTATLSSMFLLGLLGTGHCVGMCGPLILALPGRERSWVPHLLYHAGRVNTYVFFGAVLGGIGQVLQIGGEKYLDLAVWIQLFMTLFSSLFLLWFGMSRLGFLRSPAWMKTATPGMIPGFRMLQKELTGVRGWFSYYLLGVLFGFLPCGLSYAAFAVALSSSHFLKGALWVLVFALGTVPGLLFVGVSASKVFQKYREVSDLVAGMIMVGMAIHLSLNMLQVVF